MANNINWGKIYESTAWGSGVTDNNISWGKSYADLAGGGGFDADYQAVLDQASSLGYTAPSAAQQTLQNTLVTDLKTAGVWDKLDLFYVFATDGDSDYATLNWKAPSSFQATKVSSPTFTTNQGFKGDGSSAYINTNFAPSNDGVNYQLTEASKGFYIYTAPTAGNSLEGSVETFENRSISLLSTNQFFNNLKPDTGLDFSGTGMMQFILKSASSMSHWRGNTEVTCGTTSGERAQPYNQVLFRERTNHCNVEMSIYYMGGNINAYASDLNTAITNYISAL
jgi:hypothetical protein